MDPSVAKQLEEHVRVRPQGMTLWEVEAAKEGEAAKPKPVEGEVALPPREPVTIDEIVRREAQFEPLASVGGRELRIQRIGQEVTEGAKFDRFHLFDEGKKVGEMEVWLTPKGVLSIENIEAYKGGGANAFGLHAVKALLEELKREYPTATAVGGYRVTGARAAATVATRKDKMSWVQVSLKAEPEAVAKFMLDITEGLEPEAAGKIGAITTKVSKDVTIEWRPNELFTREEAKLQAVVDEVLARIAPDLNFALVDRIVAKGTGSDKAQQVH
jgi:hypothetical protein